MTVFHGDYEINFEIYELPLEEGAWRHKKLGHIPALDAKEAKKRWAEQNGLTREQEDTIIALHPLENI